MVGRPHHNFWKTGCFHMGRRADRKLVAVCLLCDRKIVNTSRSRLILHRKNCSVRGDKQSIGIDAKNETMNGELLPANQLVNKNEITAETSTPHEMNSPDDDDDDDIDIDTKQVFQVRYDEATNEFIVTTDAENIVEDPNASSSQSGISSLKKEPMPASNFTEVSSNDLNLEDINLAFSKFFVSSNIPLKTLNSKYLKDFIKKLNKSYKPPNLLELTTTYVEKICEKYKADISQEEHDAVLLLTGWNTFSNSNSSRCVMACLDLNKQTGNVGTRVYLNLWNLDTEMLGTEDEIQMRIIQESKRLAKDLYNSNIYAIISENPRLQTEPFDETLWHIVCHTYLAGRLADCIINEEDSKLVKQILFSFQKKNLEKKIIEKGGSRILLPSGKKWCSYRDSFKSFMKNMKIFRELVSNDEWEMHPFICKSIFNDELVQRIKSYHTILEPLCHLIYSSQKKTTSIADIAEEWLLLKFPTEYENYLEQTRHEALTPFVMAANFFHPVYRGRRLNMEQKIKIDYFLVESLDASGLDQLILFKRNEGIFKILSSKQIKSYDTFWSTSEQMCPELAVFAKKLLCIPASISFCDKVFNCWSTTHSTVRDLLGMDRYKNLTKAYFSLNLCNS